MAAPIYIDPKSFIQWLEENPHEIDNVKLGPGSFGFGSGDLNIAQGELTQVIERLLNTYMDREKS